MCAGVGRAGPRARGPTGSATASTPSRAQRYQLSLTEPARHNAIHGLVNWVPLAAGRAGRRRGDAGVRPAAAAGYPWPLALRTRWTVSADGLRCDARGRPTPAARTRRSGYSVHPYLQLPGRGGGRHPAARAGPEPAAGRRPAAADRRGQGGRHRVRLHRAAAGSAPPCWTPRSATSIHDADGGSAVTIAAPDGSTPRCTVWADRRVRLVAGVHRRHADRRAVPPVGRDRADDLPAGRVPLRPRPDRARAGRDLARRLGHPARWS